MGTWRVGREAGRRGGGGEPVKGVCVWRRIGKNADKPAPGILGLKVFSFCIYCRM